MLTYADVELKAPLIGRLQATEELEIGVVVIGERLDAGEAQRVRHLHTSACVSIYVSLYVSIYVSIRQHTSA